MASNDNFKTNRTEGDRKNYRNNNVDSKNNDSDGINMMVCETRAGIQPSMRELPFSITTSEVEDYLQRKLNAVVNGMRQHGLYKGDDDIDVRVITVELGSNFIPFTVVLPTSVLKDSNVRRPNNEASVFNPKDSDNTAAIYDSIAKMFSSYTYDKNDSEAFFSADWRRARGVSNTASATLKRNYRPRVQRFGNMEAVTFLIDPIRVFHDMLRIEGNNANYRIEITDWQKLRTGEFRYDMLRIINKSKKNKKGGNDIADAVNRTMTGSK